MAQISVSISRKYGSSISAKWNPDNPRLLAIDLVTYLEPIPGGDPIPYEISSVHLHGSFADLTYLANQMTDTLIKGQLELQRRETKATV